ncbi:MAG: carbohydrate ABC transporter permease [Bacilli bacterium]|nr:carbohydrate ABC transporter permease [Bacilli bacterium]
MKKVKLYTEPSHLKEKPSFATVAIFILLAIYTIGLFTPIVWAIVVSFMDKNDYSNFFGVSRAFNLGIKYTFDNYAFSWENLKILTTTTEMEYGIPDLLMHSLIYALGSAFAFTLCPVIVAYLTARFKYAFSKVVYTFVLITMTLPIVGSMASEITMLHNLKIYDSIPAVFILRFNFLSIYFLILHAQFSSIPQEYTEAAKVDGASNLRVMGQIIIPQSLNTIVTVFVLSFISYWNDYQVPLLYFPSYPTAAFGIYDFVQNASPEGNYIPIQLAATLIMALPIIIVFIIFNKKLRVSVSMGGIKG